MAMVEGQLIGSYQLISLLGQGGMATVYKAYHPKLDRYVALKMMHSSFLNDPQFLARFEREAQIIARLEHPHIVPVHDYAEFEGQPYLIMKFIAGISLKDALSDGPLELRDTMAVMSAISKALDYAHHHGVLHRDIKPSNIMLDTNATPYLTDFGLARTVQDGDSTLSQGMLIGTPAYMSPEQAAGQPVDARSDLYSLGIVLYELLVGKTPFGGGSTYTTLHAHLTEIPTPPSTLNPEIPPEVELVLMRALSKDPDERYQSAAEMYDDLRNALTQSNVQRLNPDERHSIAMSLAKPRPSSLLVRLEPSSSKPSSTASARPSGAQMSGSATAVPPTKAPQSSNTVIWVGVGVLIALLLVLIGGVLLNRQQTPSVTQAAPTAVNRNSPPEGQGMVIVPELSLAQAQAGVRENPQDPVAYLALAAVQLDVRPPQPEAVMTTLRNGLSHADDVDTYIIGALELFMQHRTPPDMAYPLYSQLLELAPSLELRKRVRARAGEHLYELASNVERTPERMLGGLRRSVDDSYNPFFHALLARTFITHGNLEMAQSMLDEIQDESPEIKLVRADLLAAQGAQDEAQAIWRELANDANVPTWISDLALFRG